jgi:hypothetical protein
VNSPSCTGERLYPNKALMGEQLRKMKNGDRFIFGPFVRKLPVFVVRFISRAGLTSAQAKTIRREPFGFTVWTPLN